LHGRGGFRKPAPAGSVGPLATGFLPAVIAAALGCYGSRELDDRPGRGPHGARRMSSTRRAATPQHAT
jgi:hypothetical protein